MKIKCYDKNDWNPYCFFQPAIVNNQINPILMIEGELDNNLPNPMEKYRIPVPRLVPRGFR